MYVLMTGAEQLEWSCSGSTIISWCSEYEGGHGILLSNCRFETYMYSDQIELFANSATILGTSSFFMKWRYITSSSFQNN